MIILTQSLKIGYDSAHLGWNSVAGFCYCCEAPSDFIKPEKAVRYKFSDINITEIIIINIEKDTG
jgi:hypothetical protein